MDACIFNKTSKGEVPVSILYEDEVTLASMVRLFIWWALEGVVALNPTPQRTDHTFSEDPRIVDDCRLEDSPGHGKP